MSIGNDSSIDNTVGYTVWETTKLPKKWMPGINSLDEVWVPSEFNKKCLQDSGVRGNISVKPYIFHKQNLPDKSKVNLYDFLGNKIPNDKYTFYSIGEFNNRKGILDLISAYTDIKSENSQLILKLHFKSYSDADKLYCINNIFKVIGKELGKSIFVLLHNLKNSELLALHSFGDCYVSLNKGEGFGLPIFDAYHYGNDVITNRFGAPREFLGESYEGLVDYKLENVSGMENFSSLYTDDQQWGIPNVEHAKELMKLKI